MGSQAAGIAEKRNLSKDGYSVLQSDEALHRNRRNPLSNHTPIYIPEWREMDFGEFEGKNYIELQKNPNYQAWIDSNGTLPFPGGESREAFIKRCEQGFYRMLIGIKGRLQKMDEKQPASKITAGAVVHGGTIMAILSSFTEEIILIIR